jgi:large subunit ribosomal protein L5
MADNENKKPEGGYPKVEKADKADKAEKKEKAPKAEAKGEKAPKGEGKGGEKKPGAKAEGKGGGEKKGGKEKKGAEFIKRTAPPRLQTAYKKDLVPRLMKELQLKNVMEVPRLVKITVNMGLGEAVQNPKILDTAVEELRQLTGQQPVVTKSKKAIANFKLRAGLKIGAMVTLRRERMWEFLDRLVSLALPRVRDFKGVSPKAFDGRGNYSLGIREQIIFPEINYDKIDKIKGMNITIVTTARTDDEGRALLRLLGMPFRQPGDKDK